jgi:hypothetical protein
VARLPWSNRTTCGRRPASAHVTRHLSLATFTEFFEKIGALGLQQQQDIARVMEIASKFGLEILSLPGA